MSQPRSLLISLTFLLLLLGLLSFSRPAAAESVHYSYTALWDSVDRLGGGSDITVLYGGSFGIRVTKFPGMLFRNSFSQQVGEDQVEVISVSGKYESTMLLIPIDYRTFEGKDRGPFDFMTAFWGVGVADQELRISKDSYLASGGRQNKTSSSEIRKARLYSTAAGFYGGEKFVVLEFRLHSIYGEIEKNDFSGDAITINKLLLIVGIGIGF